MCGCAAFATATTTCALSKSDRDGYSPRPRLSTRAARPQLPTQTGASHRAPHAVRRHQRPVPNGRWALVLRVDHPRRLQPLPRSLRGRERDNDDARVQRLRFSVPRVRHTAIRSDNGPPFASTGAGGLSERHRPPRVQRRAAGPGQRLKRPAELFETSEKAPDTFRARRRRARPRLRASVRRQAGLHAVARETDLREQRTQRRAGHARSAA